MQSLDPFTSPSMPKRLPTKHGEHFYKGDLVQVRTEEDIRSTLDAQGKLDGITFMPEMARFCGGHYRVEGRLEKVFIEGHGFLGSLSDTLKLEDVQCDGSSHAGCQRGCLLLWKEAWLQQSEAESVPSPMMQSPPLVAPPSSWQADDPFTCQATELVRAVHRYPPWALWRYPRDFLVGERTLGQVMKIIALMGINKIRLTLGLPLHGSTRGQLQKTPQVCLSLQPGDWVRVKSQQEIRVTLDTQGRNRGLSFTTDMARFCGQTFRVRRRLERGVVDFVAQVRQFSDTVMLEGVYCSGIPLGGCQRRCYHFWREAWLEKIDPPPSLHLVSGAES
jgi:hypothetical protein